MYKKKKKELLYDFDIENFIYTKLKTLLSRLCVQRLNRLMLLWKHSGFSVCIVLLASL